MEEQKLYDDFTVSVFQRGYEKGYEEGKGQTWSEETLKTESEMYAKGLNDAWEYIKKLGKLTIGELYEIFGDGYDNIYAITDDYDAQEFIDVIKRYEDKIRPNCSYLNDICPYDIKCEECEVHCSIARARQKLKGDKEK